MLCMTMFDRTTDRAVFGGQVQYLVGPSDVCCADHFLDEPGGNGGIAVTFDGFITDTNSVKSLLAFVDGFLQSNEIANDPPTW